VEVEKNLTCERPYARHAFSYFYGPDDVEWIFVGEDNDGIEYYVNFIEFEVREINPSKFFYEEWSGHRITDKYYPDMLTYEFCKDVERYGLTWRLYVRIGLYKEDKEDKEEKVNSVDSLNELV